MTISNSKNLPLDDQDIDLVISNCVLNLSSDKRRVFHEIFRVLKPNGRLVVSDITYDQNIPLEIKYNETLRGECIGGALSYLDLFGLLNDIGFSHSKIVKGYHYRTVKEYDFYSITYQAVKRPQDQPPVLYDFPDFSRILSTVTRARASRARACGHSDGAKKRWT
jgi:ubiquinone/menaquinone biosynthesis C-methylase UbiE